MIEEEARKKWCPYVGLVKANEALTGNAEGTNNCIASDCMMWRTDSVINREGDNVPCISGYCGKGGKP